jgi:hypothetical protein
MKTLTELKAVQQMRHMADEFASLDRKLARFPQR